MAKLTTKRLAEKVQAETGWGHVRVVRASHKGKQVYAVIVGGGRPGYLNVTPHRYTLSSGIQCWDWFPSMLAAGWRY